MNIIEQNRPVHPRKIAARLAKASLVARLQREAAEKALLANREYQARQAEYQRLWALVGLLAGWSGWGKRWSRERANLHEIPTSEGLKSVSSMILALAVQARLPDYRYSDHRRFVIASLAVQSGVSVDKARRYVMQPATVGEGIRTRLDAAALALGWDQLTERSCA